ncbi:unnamed protein product [Trichogramma brassicae]|uniref:Uncharacterized protein n=1 Tax=Trichogramma brassicae TaxID=86971 RepID=A0A6H5IIB4_9HYME|nr:unnamed protein product [Trichogramma brassicae]
MKRMSDRCVQLYNKGDSRMPPTRCRAAVAAAAAAAAHTHLVGSTSRGFEYVCGCVCGSTMTASTPMPSQQNEIKVRSYVEQAYNDNARIQDYESDVDDFTIATQVNDNSDVSLLSLDLEPIILKTEEKRKLVVSAATVRREREQDVNDSEHHELAETRKRAAMVESLMAHRMRTPSPEPEMIKLLASDDAYRFDT